MATTGQATGRYHVIPTTPTGQAKGHYTVIPVGFSDLASGGAVRQHVNLTSLGRIAGTGRATGRYRVIERLKVTTTLAPIRDAFVWDKEPTLNYGDVQDIAVGRSGGYLARGLVQFDVSTLRTDLIILSAVLRLRCRFAGFGEIGVYPLLGTWDELGVTWANQPPASPVPTATVAAPSQVGEAVDLDITDLFLGWYQGTRVNHGLGLRVTDETAMAATLFGAREAGANWQPQLLVTYYEPEAIPEQSDLPDQGTVRLSGLNHLLGFGEVASLKQESQCMSWVTGWYGYYTDLLSQSFAQDWNLPTLCELIRESGSERCNSTVLTQRDFTREIWISETTRVIVYVVWVTSVDLRDTSNPYLNDPRYCYCKVRDSDVQVPVFTAFADVQDLVGGTCWLTSSGAVNRREVMSSGFARQVSNLTASGFVKGLERSDLATAGAASRRDAFSSGTPRFAATSDLASTGSPRVPAWNDLASAGMADLGPNSLPTTGTVPEHSDLPSAGTPANTPDTLPASGLVADRSDVPSTGQTGTTPDQLPSTGSPRVPGWNDMPTKAHATTPWMASAGAVRQRANLYSVGRVRVHVSLPSSGFIYHRGLSELPSEGWPRVRDASDLLSTAMAKAAHSDIGSGGIVAAVVLEIDIDLSAWPPEGRSAFPAD